MNPLLYIVAATAAFYKLNLTHTHINRNDSPSSLTTSSKQSLPTLAIYSDTSTILPATTICSGISVLDATIQLLDAKGIPYKLSTDAYGSYLTSINNINQSFNSAQNTWNAWLYTVNNTIPDKLSSDYIIKKNDSVEWVYSTNYITRNTFGKNNIGHLN